MFRSVPQSITNQSIKRGQTSEKLLVNWRHFHNTTSVVTLFNTGVTTSYPYAYGRIPVPFNCFVESVIISANKFSSEGTPTGTSSTMSIYKGEGTLVKEKTVTYTPSEGMTLTFDFGETAPINTGEKIALRYQSNGLWKYMNSTIVIVQR